MNIRELMLSLNGPSKTTSVCGGIRISIYIVGEDLYYLIVRDPDGRWILVARDLTSKTADELFDTMMNHYGGDNG